MNNEATHVKTQEDYSKFSSIVNEFLQEQMNEDFMEKNLLEAGVTSLQMMRISNALRKHGYKISFAKMISDPYVKHWWDNADINVKRKSVPPLETSNNSPKQFPLTDVQYAYWVGRKEGQVLGGNACHAYFEFDPDTVNLERLQEAWEELQARHPMLRAKFNNNGTQEIMEKPYSAKLQIYDFEHDLLAVREKLSHRKLDIANGQVAELGISLLPEDKLRMHFDIDLLVADMQSLQIIFRDLAAIYNSEYRPAIPENWDFGIYLENEKNNKINDYRKAEKYWKSEIESLPLGPALTLRTQPETIAAPKFSRRKYLLEHKKWEKLKSLAAQYCTTPAMVLLTLYAAVLDRWSTNQSWDVRDGVFPEGFVNDAFEAFSLLIERLCTNLKVWEQVHPVELPLKTGKVRKSVNKTEKDLPDKMLHEGFYNCLQNCPDEIALIAAEGTFSYKKLGSYVAGIQNELCKSGFRKGDFVAISADKGMWQIAAVLAVLFSGGVYLPFDVSQPIARQNKILEKSGTKYLITNKKYQSLEWKEHIVVLAAEDINRTEQALTIVEIPLENPAYIIHTSGTTGDPKGVVISHKAAVNTIEDINSRFDINSADRMFGLANLAFDLSVYDIFGAFNAGAALVLPDPEKQKDPYYWVETIKKNEITVWNSVPAQMQMLVSVLESRGVSGDFPLKVVLLSGDWIPVTLPDQIHTSCKKAKVVSLGGATEAAIWSIYHEIEEVPDGAVSIPYGKPLANQKFYVLNEKMEQCPDWVPGDLYIGGKGLALEYLNKPEETNAHFMYDEQLQERIYKTGDIGRYWPDGTIEFMGREDTQVKIHGHRIELSEIESALLSNTLG